MKIFMLMLALAQQPGASSVSGVVYDSVARAPLGGAEVQLMRADTAGAPQPRSIFARADAAGHFEAAGVPAGTWLAAYFHPALDSLGIEAPPRKVAIADGRATRIDLASPSARTIARSVCGATAATDSSTLIVGFVRDAATRGARPGVAVQVTWSDIVIDRSGPRRELRRVEARSFPNGWFAACGVPTGARLGLRAFANADSSGMQEIETGAEHLLHRDLWLGGSGDVRAALRGSVRGATGRAIAGARVAIAGTSDTASTGDDGSFTLARAHAGTQTLEVRALGYVPLRQTVDILVGDPPSQANVTLVGVRAFIDTFRVRDRRVYAADANGFEARRRNTGVGSFLDRRDVERTGATEVTDVFRSMNGVRLEGSRGLQTIWVRSDYGGFCRPDIWVDGTAVSYGDMKDSTSDNLESVQVREIAGIEIYRGANQAPPQYNTALGACGTILIWTAPPQVPEKLRKP